MRLSRRLLGASADFFSENLRVDFFNGKILRAEVFFRVRAVDFFGILRLVEFFFGGRDIMHSGLSVFFGNFF